MRRFIHNLGQVNFLFKLLSWVLELGHFCCVFMPLSMLNLSPLLALLISIVVLFLDKPAPTIAWFAHLVIWLASIPSAVRCQEPRLLTFYLICAAAYFAVEIIGTGALLLVSSKKSNR